MPAWSPKISHCALTWQWRGIGLIAAVSVVIHGSLDLHSVHIDSPLTIFRKLKVVVTLVWCLFVCSLSSMWHDTGPTLTLRTCWPETCFSGSEESGGDIGPVLWHVTLLTSAPGAGRGARLSSDCWLHQQEDFKTSTFELGGIPSSMMKMEFQKTCIVFCYI